LGKPTRVGGTSTGVGRTGAARLAACHRIRKGEGVARQKRKEVRGLRPCEEPEPEAVIRTSFFSLLQKSSGDVGPRISSANALQKERSGSSERGSSSERRSAGDTVGRRVGRKDRRASGSPASDGESTGTWPRVARERHSAVDPSRKRWCGRGTGVVKTTGSCEGHPDDRRHPGSSRGVPFTRSAHG